MRSLPLSLETIFVEPQETLTKKESYWKTVSPDRVQHELVNDKRRFILHAKAGIPPSYRWDIWKALIIKDGVREQYPAGYYAKISSEITKWSSEIEIDVPRTFPELTCFDIQAQRSLRNVLNAISVHSPSVRYCQGMNFVCGFLLLVSGLDEREEENVFWFFSSILDNIGVTGLYSKGFPLLIRLSEAFDVQLEHSEPEVARILASIDIKNSMFLHKWLLTLFVTALPLCTVAVVWDYFLCMGPEALVTSSVAICSIAAPILRRLSSLELVIQFLRSLKDPGDVCQVRIGCLITRKAYKMQLLV